MDGTGPTLVHVKAQVSGILSTNVRDLWNVIRDYAHSHSWFGTYRGVKTFTTLLAGSINCQIGAMRYVSFGQHGFVDQLEALDDDRYIMKYKLISHPDNTNPFPDPFLNFRAVIHLEEVTRGQHTFMKWVGEFDTEPLASDRMQQAILDVFEAGFQGLEALIAPPRPVYQPTAAGIGVRSSHGSRGMGEVQQSLANMHLKHSAATMPTYPYNPLGPQELHPTSRVHRPGPMQGYMGEMPMAPNGRQYDNTFPPPSPHQSDTPTFGTRRPGSGGQLNMNLNHWTSGGSGSTINLSTLPGRRSGEDIDVVSRRQHRPRDADGIPEGSPYVDPYLDQPPPSLFDQAEHDRAAEAAEERFARYQKEQMRQVDLEMHHRDCSLGSASTEPPAESPYQQSSPHMIDPLILEKEEFKAALLALRSNNNTSEGNLYSAQQGGITVEPDWSQVMQQKDEGVRGTLPANPPHPSSEEPGSRMPAAWTQALQQQHQASMQERERKARNKSPGPPTPRSHPPGGPFAAANGNPGNLPRNNSGLPPTGSMRRTPSRQSLATLSPATSGALDRSAGSAVDEVVAQLRAR